MGNLCLKGKKTDGTEDPRTEEIADPLELVASLTGLDRLECLAALSPEPAFGNPRLQHLSQPGAKRECSQGADLWQRDQR